MEKQATIDFDKIIPFYQPIYNLNTHSVVRYECLARLISESEELVLPQKFIRCIQRSSMTAQLTEHMLKVSTRFCGKHHLKWNINIFAADIEDTDVIDQIAAICQQIDHGLCGIELSYSTVKHNSVALAKLIQRLPQIACMH